MTDLQEAADKFAAAAAETSRLRTEHDRISLLSRENYEALLNADEAERKAGDGLLRAAAGIPALTE